MLWEGGVLRLGVSVLWAAERTVSVDAEREARTELEEQSECVCLSEIVRSVRACVCVRAGQ